MKTMRKPLSVLLSVLLALAVFPLAFATAFADPASDFIWTYDETTETLTVTGTGEIPATMTMDEIEEEEDFTSFLAHYPHPEYLNAKHVVLSEGITAVGEMTFFFSRMQTLSLPSTLERIDKAAFAYCTMLEEVNFPAALKSIGDYGFAVCGMLREIILPEGLETLGEAAFAECAPNVLRIPSTLQFPADKADLRYYFTTAYLTDLYNDSLTAYLSGEVYNLGSAAAAQDAAVRLGLMMAGEMLAMTFGFYDEEEPTAQQLDAAVEAFSDFAAYVNGKLGTAYTVASVEDISLMMSEVYQGYDSAPGTPAYFTVYCAENSEQHTACADAGFRHKVGGSADYCLNEAVFSGEADGLTWVVDPNAGTLTIGGTGSLSFPDGAPWRSAASYFDSVLFTADCGITDISFDWSNNPFANCNLERFTLPAGLQTISDSSLSMLAERVKAFDVSEGSTVFYAEGGALYKYLTAEKRSALAAESLDPGAADLMLCRVPRAAEQLVISDRTAIILPNAVYSNRYITSLDIPDSVLSIENGAVYSNARLANVTLGAGVKLLKGESIKLGDYGFTATLTVSESNPWIKADGTGVYSKDGSRLILLINPQTVTELTLGEEVTALEESVFSNTYELKKLTVLNPALDLNSTGLRSDTVVYGYEGSPAQAYCETFGVVFIVIETDEIDHIEIASAPTVTAYAVGDTLCLDGLKIAVHFAGGGSAVRTSGFEVSECDMNTVGEKTVTVTYGGKSAAFSVTVADSAAPYEIGVGQSLDLLLLPTDYSYDYAADVKFVCTEDGSPVARLSDYLTGASWYIQLFDENMEKITDLTDGGSDYAFEAGKTYYFHCVVYVSRTDANHAARLTLYAPHDHYAETRTETMNAPTCSASGYEVIYCAVCGKYLSGRTLETLPHDIGENGYCTMCGKLYGYTIGDGEVKSFVTENYNYGDAPVIGTYTAAEAKTVTISIVQNSNYGGPFVRRGDWYFNYEWNDELHMETYTVDVQPGDVLEIGVYPCFEKETVIVAVDHTHNFVQHGETVEPTCTRNGYVPYRCEGCGAEFNRTLYAIPHVSDGVYEELGEAPNCVNKSNGCHNLRCAVCGNIYYEGINWEHTDADKDGVCDLCGDGVGTWLELNQEVSITAEGQGYKPFPFTAPADGDYFFTAKMGSSYCWVSVKNMGDYYMGGEPENNGVRVTMKAGETRAFCAYCYDMVDCTAKVTDIHQPTAVAAVPATCAADGNIAYWECEICGKLFADEACTVELAPEDVIIEGGHQLVYEPEIQAYCDAPGRQDYWHCTECGKNFSDEAATQEITNMDNLTVYTMHHMTKIPGEPATCTSDGTLEYWFCTSCQKKYADSVGLDGSLSDEDLVIPGGHVMVEHPGAQATCTENGSLPYYECTRCGNFYVDGLGENLIEDRDSVILPAGHSPVAHEAKDPGCETDGSIAYWSCENCEKVFSDAACTVEIAPESTVIPARHTLTRVAPKAATCKDAGNVEYWHCAVCGKNFGDENGRNELADVTEPANGNHVWNEGTVTRAATCVATGEKVYTCTVCGNTRNEILGLTGHTDANNDGLCDNCGRDLRPAQPQDPQPGQPEQQSNCVCGEYHTGPFAWLVKFFHRIIYFFRNLFSR